MVCIDAHDEDPGSGAGQAAAERFAVVAGSGRHKAMQALVEDKVFDANHPVR